MGTYARPDFVLSHGNGVYVYDTEGRQYLDFLAGIAVNALGHCNSDARQILQDQAAKLWHVSNLYYTEPQIKLAKLLVDNTFGDKVFFCNSGTEAIEGAIKFARKWAKETKAKDCFEIIAFHDSFHGRTFGSLSATGQPNFWDGFEPLLPGFKFATFNDLDSVPQLLNAKTCAILVEPIQGEGGIYPAEPDFLKGLREICDEKNVLLILDEIQCGLGRTGTFCAYEQYNITPDILTIAKPLAGGLPMGAIIITDEVAKYMQVGDHGSTFGGGPLVAAVAEYIVSKICNDSFLDRVKQNGKYLLSKLEQLKSSFKEIKSVRGRGLMVGIELQTDPKIVSEACVRNGLLLCKAGDSTIRFLPPLIVEKDQIDKAVDKLENALKITREGHGKKSKN